MQYTDYGSLKTYVVIHTTGFGEQGGEPIRRHETIGSADTREEAMAIGRARFPADPSGWTYDDFTIDINTSTSKGKEELAKFSAKCTEVAADILAHPENYHTVYADGFTITIKKDSKWDEPRVLTPGTQKGFPLESYRMLFIDLNEDTPFVKHEKTGTIFRKFAVSGDDKIWGIVGQSGWFPKEECIPASETEFQDYLKSAHERTDNLPAK